MASFLILGLGAAMMYLLDPDHGRRRRGLLRDALVHRNIEDQVTRQVSPTDNLTEPSTTPKAAARYAGAERRKDRSPYRSAERRASL